MITSLQKSQEMENQTSASHLESLQNVGAKDGHQYHKRTDTLDKIQNMVLQEEEEEKRKIKNNYA